MTFDTRNALAIQAARSINVGRGSGGGGFAPLYAQNYSGAELNSIPAEDWRHSQIVDSPSFSGGRSAQLGRNLAVGDPVDPENCGGAFYGRRIAMPTVTEGYSVWQRFRIHIPSTFSWGYAYSGGSNEADNPCGRPADGSTNSLKFLVFSPDVGTARIYLNLDPPKRQVSQKESPNIRILIEAGAQVNLQQNFPIPLDQWVSFQMAAKVSNQGEGWVRVWVDDDLICELTDISNISSSATGLSEWGIGDYWNGVPWSDGAEGREHFYVDDIIVATDLPGYGAPITLDYSGNPYIANSTNAGDVA